MMYISWLIRARPILVQWSLVNLSLSIGDLYCPIRHRNVISNISNSHFRITRYCFRSRHNASTKARRCDLRWTLCFGVPCHYKNTCEPTIPFGTNYSSHPTIYCLVPEASKHSTTDALPVPLFAKLSTDCVFVINTNSEVFLKVFLYVQGNQYPDIWQRKAMIENLNKGDRIKAIQEWMRYVEENRYTLTARCERGFHTFVLSDDCNQVSDDQGWMIGYRISRSVETEIHVKDEEICHEYDYLTIISGSFSYEKNIPVAIFIFHLFCVTWPGIDKSDILLSCRRPSSCSRSSSII